MLEQKRIRSHNTAARKENKGDGQGPKKRCAVTQQRRPCRRRAAMRHTQGRKTPCAVRVAQRSGTRKAGKRRAPSESCSNAEYTRPEKAVRRPSRAAMRHTQGRKTPCAVTQHGTQPHAVRHTASRSTEYSLTQCGIPKAGKSRVPSLSTAYSLTQHGIQPHAVRHTQGLKKPHAAYGFLSLLRDYHHCHPQQ